MPRENCCKKRTAKGPKKNRESILDIWEVHTSSGLHQILLKRGGIWNYWERGPPFSRNYIGNTLCISCFLSSWWSLGIIDVFFVRIHYFPSREWNVNRTLNEKRLVLMSLKESLKSIFISIDFTSPKTLEIVFLSLSAESLAFPKKWSHDIHLPNRP